MSMLEIRNLKKSFFHTPVLDGISFTIKEGESVSLTGPNGAGKTTLLKILSGITSKDSGEIIRSFNSFLYLGHAPGIYAGLSPLENVNLIAKLHHCVLNSQRVEKAFSEFGLASHKTLASRVLSQGMLQRLKLMLASLLDWELLLFDEPYSALDEEGQSIADTLFKLWETERKTILFVDHNLERSRELSARQFILQSGFLHEDSSR